MPNTVIAHYHPLGFTNDITDTDDHAVELFQPSLEVEKGNTGPPVSKVGDIVSYEFWITNTSSPDSPDLILDSADDSLLGDLTDEARAAGCDPLAPGASCHFTTPYTIPNGASDPLTNVFNVHYHPDGFPNDITAEAPAEHTVDLFQPAIEFDKTGEEGTFGLGQEVNYTLTLRNTSSADTPDLECTITDDKLEISETVTLPSGESYVVNPTYTIVPEDCDQVVTNTAHVVCSPIGFPNEYEGSDSHNIIVVCAKAKLYVASDGEDADGNSDNDRHGTIEVFNLPSLDHYKTIVPDDEPPWEDPWGMAVYSPCLFVADFNEREGESGRELSHLYAINTHSDEVVASIVVEKGSLPSCISNNPEGPPEPPQDKDSTHPVHIAVITSGNTIYIYVANHSNPPVVTVFSAALGDPTCQMTLVITRNVNESDASPWCRWSTGDWGFFGATAAPDEGCVYLTKRQYGSTGIWRMCLPDNELEYVGPTDSLEDCGWYDKETWHPQPSDPCYPPSALFDQVIDQVAELGKGISAAGDYSPSTAEEACRSDNALNVDVWTNYFSAQARCDPPQKDRDHWDKARPFSILYHSHNLYVDFALIDQVWEVDPDDLLDPIEPDPEGRCPQCCPTTCGWWEENEGPYPVYHEDQNPYDPCQRPECPWDVWPGGEPPKPRFEHITMTTGHQDPQPDSGHGGQGLAALGDCVFVSNYNAQSLSVLTLNQSDQCVPPEPSSPVTPTATLAHVIYLPVAGKNFASGPLSDAISLPGSPKGLTTWEEENLLFATLPIDRDENSLDWVAVVDVVTLRVIDYIEYPTDVPNAPSGYSHDHPHSAIVVDLERD